VMFYIEGVVNGKCGTLRDAKEQNNCFFGAKMTLR